MTAPHASLLLHKNIYYFSRSQDPQSSLWHLIQGIWQEYSPEARAILRERIYTTEKLSPLNHGIIKIAAKRVAAAQNPDEIEKILANAKNKIQIQFTNCYQPPSEYRKQLNQKLTQEEIIQLLKNLAAIAPKTEHRHQQARAVGAIILDKNNTVLALAHNTNHQNKTLHAEVNLLQAWPRAHNQPLPDGSRIITSLEPCKMCAGLIHSRTENLKNFRLEFLENDHGPATRQNWLTTHRI
jgi:deoxycytidylate deaminase